MASSDQIGLCVMIIDDQKTMRSIIKQLLNQEGVENTIEATNGEDAIALIREARAAIPDIIICDLHMDKMDGMEFVTLLRKGRDIAINKDTPVLILTGDRDQFVHDAAEQVGATKILTKPISSEDLIMEIHNAIGSSG